MHTKMRQALTSMHTSVGGTWKQSFTLSWLVVTCTVAVFTGLAAQHTNHWATAPLSFQRYQSKVGHKSVILIRLWKSKKADGWVHGDADRWARIAVSWWTGNHRGSQEYLANEKHFTNDFVLFCFVTLAPFVYIYLFIHAILWTAFRTHCCEHALNPSCMK